MTQERVVDLLVAIVVLVLVTAAIVALVSDGTTRQGASATFAGIGAAAAVGLVRYVGSSKRRR